jgi:hypothetical protein
VQECGSTDFRDGLREAQGRREGEDQEIPGCPSLGEGRRPHHVALFDKRRLALTDFDRAHVRINWRAAQRIHLKLAAIIEGAALARALSAVVAFLVSSSSSGTKNVVREPFRSPGHEAPQEAAAPALPRPWL